MGGSLLCKRVKKPRNQALGPGQVQFAQVRSGELPWLITAVIPTRSEPFAGLPSEGFAIK